MAKRIVTKIGDIFCVVVDDDYKCFFQYIANDMTQLNSSVIRVFKRHYPIENNPDFNEIVKDEVSFYSHTVLSAGIRLGYWEKVGKHSDLGDLENVAFKMTEDFVISGLKKSSHWFVWKLNEPFLFVGELTDEYRNADIGMVFSYLQIVHKIKTGDYKTKFPE